VSNREGLIGLSFCWRAFDRSRHCFFSIRILADDAGRGSSEKRGGDIPGLRRHFSSRLDELVPGIAIRSEGCKGESAAKLEASLSSSLIVLKTIDYQNKKAAQFWLSGFVV
jgi:hypothetical protein